ncbi:hypothetical protein KUTeg_004692 [Tegillarca granosa]|uniref:DEK-C domain-containing protein n=1 Tax=Tegillarca granosa TaxID=220873 RepID=A0ABQ9FHJ5_TEGGR|nr:hypothetical protein KUTeg_004692 [Tegillarca granosa]
MASLSEKELRTSVKEILKNADLSSLSVKKVRKQLEEKHKVDLTERKKEVDAIVMELVTNGVESEEDETKKNGATDDVSDPSEDEEPEYEPPKKKVKPVKKVAVKPEPKKSKEVVSRAEVDNSDEDDDDNDDLNDEEVAQKLQDEENSRKSRSRAAKRPPKPQKVRVKKKEKSTESKGKYGKPCLLSAELADVMGTDKDPKNKQFMLCDDQLYKVFGKKRVRTFGMMKDLKCHIKDEFAVTS